MNEIAIKLVSTEPSTWSSYGLRPLDVVNSPEAPLAARLWDAVAYNLDYLIEHQQSDGSWRPTWTWGDAYPEFWPEAERQWAGVITLGQLLKLRAFARLEKE